jgi:hypothetical protein
MSEQVVPSAVGQRINVKFLTNENVKTAEILKRLRAQLGDETPSRMQAYNWISNLKKAEKGLKAYEDYTFCRENYDQHFW